MPSVKVEVKGPDDPDVPIRGVPLVGNGLAMSLAFSQQSYRVGDRATAVLTLTNTGTTLLSDLVASCRLPNLEYDRADLGQLTPGGEGVTLPAGATGTYPITVPITGWAAAIGHVRLECTVGAPPYSNGPSTRLTAVACVPWGTAPTVVGILLKFLWKPPLGEPYSTPIPQVEVYLRSSVSGAVVARDVTDDRGFFTFHDLPVGPYRIGVVGPWQLTWAPPGVRRASRRERLPLASGLRRGRPGPARSGCC